MAKLTLQDVSTNYASTTQINSNNALIETALENTLSRDGTSPNQMEASLDMNGYSLINASNATITASDLGNTVFVITASEFKTHMESSSLKNVIVSTAITLTASVTGHVNSNLIVYNGGSIDGAFTLSIAGQVQAGSYVIFGSSLTVTGLSLVRAAWFAVGDGTTDDFATLGKASASLADNGEFIFSGGKTFYIAGDGNYVTIDGSNVTVRFEEGSKLITQASDDPEYTSTHYYAGLTLDATNTELVNPQIRGGIVRWTGEVMNVWGGKFWNMHNAAILPNSTASFEKLGVYGTEFNTTLDLGQGRFTAVQRTAASATYLGKLAIFIGCKFRGVPGAVNIHSLEKLLIRDSYFRGGYEANNLLKVSADTGPITTKHDVVIDGNTFDGNPADSGSTNTNLSSYPAYVLFLDYMRSITFTNNTAFDLASSTAGVHFVTAGQEANSIIEGNTFDTVAVPLSQVSGFATIRDNDFEDCGAGAITFGGATHQSQQVIFEENFVVNSQIKIGNRGVSTSGGAGSIYIVRDNTIQYNTDGNGAIQYTDESPSATNYPDLVLVEDNNIIIDTQNRGIYSAGNFPYLQSRNNKITGAITVADDTIGYVQGGKFVAIYDFDILGGSQGPISIGSLPDNCSITYAAYEVITAFTSAGAALVQFGVSNDQAGISSNLAFDNAIYSVGLHDGIPDHTIANYTTKTTADKQNILITISTADLTAGKVIVFGDYIESL